jgi:predicted transcriptional regulator
VNEVWGLAEKSRRVLQAAAVEANGRPGMYVLRDRIMSRVNISELAEFQLIAEHLERKGSIAEADADYGVFILTPEGVDEPMN